MRTPFGHPIEDAPGVAENDAPGPVLVDELVDEQCALRLVAAGHRFDPRSQ